MNNFKMTCPLQTDNADVLLDYCARVLDPERKAMLEMHMAQCVGCREMAESQTQIWAAMDLYEAEPIAGDFDRKLYAKIAERETVPVWERYWAPVREYLQGQPAWKPVLSIAAASAALALVFLVRNDVPAPEAPSAVVIDVREVEQAERALEDIEMLRQLDAPTPVDSAPKDVL